MNPLPSPSAVRGATPGVPEQVAGHRRAVADIIDGLDDRLLVVVGPCSAHDPVGLMEYARRLTMLAAQHRDDLLVVLRVYGEKPRSRHGWPGLMIDPDRNAEHDVPQGIRLTRDLLARVAALGLPTAAEFVEPLLASYLSDLVSWGAIGARSVESPPHRRLASALAMPVGIKNRTDGAIAPAVDAIAVANRPQPVVGLAPDGRPQWHVSAGNPHAHLVLRGGATGGNYRPDQIRAALAAVHDAATARRIVVDCSHGNSGKDHRRQPAVADAVAAQIETGQHGIAGVMLESFLREGRQPATGPLRPGISITDACLSIDQTGAVLDRLAGAARWRRRHHPMATATANRHTASTNGDEPLLIYKE